MLYFTLFKELCEVLPKTEFCISNQKTHAPFLQWTDFQ